MRLRVVHKSSVATFTHLFESFLSSAALILVSLHISRVDLLHVLDLSQEFLCRAFMDDIDEIIETTKERDQLPKVLLEIREIIDTLL
jgi:hypothetical protein